jgi:hypothetical protein
MELFAGLVVIVFGLLLLTVGYRIFLALLPLIAFMVGLFTGMTLVHEITNEGFLTSLLSVAAGVGLAILFAALALLFWALGVIIALAGAGFAVGYALLPALGIDLPLVSILIGLLVGLAAGMAAVILRLPRALIIGLTSLWGAGGILAGAFTVLGTIGSDDLSFGGIHAVLAESPLWTLVWLVISAVGMVVQWQTTDDFVLTIPGTDGLPTPRDPRLS